MASRTYTIKKGWNGIYNRAEFGEVEASQNDTFTLSNFDSATNLSNVYLMKQTDGTEMTNTHAALNVVTVTGAGTNIRCIYLAYGKKAT